MRFILTATFLATVASCIASPTVRQVAAPCDGLGGGGFDNASNFTVAAFNRTQPNANNTGAPLVLGQAGAILGAEFEVFSTYASFPFNDWPLLSLVDGGLRAVSNTGIKTTSSGAVNGGAISFVTSSSAPAPAKVFCAVANTDPAGGSTGFPAIALNGQTDLFSLCMTDTSARAQNNVIFNATENNSGSFIFSTCYPVTLQLVQQEQ